MVKVEAETQGREIETMAETEAEGQVEECLTDQSVLHSLGTSPCVLPSLPA